MFHTRPKGTKQTRSLKTPKCEREGKPKINNICRYSRVVRESHESLGYKKSYQGQSIADSLKNGRNRGAKQGNVNVQQEE